LAAEHIGDRVATLESLRLMRALFPPAVLVFAEYGRVTGVLGTLPLTARGRDALVDGKLDLARLGRTDVAETFEASHGLYAMGIVAITGAAARAVVSGVVRLRERFAFLPFYARPLTAAGRRVLVERLGCAPVAGTSLYWSPPTATEAVA
jgi:hypothetical protein